MIINKLRKIPLIIFAITILSGCGNPDVSIVVKNEKKGKILINGNPLSSKIGESQKIESNEMLYYLDLNKGHYEFQFIFVDSTKVIKHLDLEGGEAYLGVDLVTGDIEGFD